MSDLVGNPNCWFSHANAKMAFVASMTIDCFVHWHVLVLCMIMTVLLSIVHSYRLIKTCTQLQWHNVRILQPNIDCIHHVI